MKKALVLFDNSNGNMYYLGLIEDDRFTQLTTSRGVITTLDVAVTNSGDSKDYLFKGLDNNIYKINNDMILALYLDNKNIEIDIEELTEADYWDGYESDRFAQ